VGAYSAPPDHLAGFGEKGRERKGERDRTGEGIGRGNGKRERESEEMKNLLHEAGGWTPLELRE